MIVHKSDRREMDLLELIAADDNDVDEINLIIFGMPRRVYNRAHYFHSFDQKTFFQRFRVTKETSLYLLEMIERHIEFPYNL